MKPHPLLLAICSITIGLAILTFMLTRDTSWDGFNTAAPGALYCRSHPDYQTTMRTHKLASGCYRFEGGEKIVLTERNTIGPWLIDTYFPDGTNGHAWVEPEGVR